MEIGLLCLRLVVGGLIAGHGAQKLFGVLGGSGLDGTAGFFNGLGLKPGALHARVAGAAEFGGGIMLVLGLLTPFGAAAVIAVMTAAIITVHARNGIWSSDGGYEYNLVLIAVAFALSGIGAGEISLDHALGLDLNGASWAFAALAAGLIGGMGAVQSGRSAARHEPTRVRPTRA